MCLTIYSGESKPLIAPTVADADIVCYKVLKFLTHAQSYATPYQDVQLDYNGSSVTTKTSDLVIFENWVWADKKANIFTQEVEVGLHSFADKKDTVTEIRSWLYSDRGRSDLWRGIISGFAIVKCIIPKGAEYYEGKFEIGIGICTLKIAKSYASDTLIYLKQKIKICA